jgi:hypothetical protein
MNAPVYIISAYAIDLVDKNGEITNYRARLPTNKSDVSMKKYQP